jgi:lipopolysaccharide biosynthesis glycosyltransferase
MDTLEKLWNIDISKNSIAGVLDHVGIQNKLKIGDKNDIYKFWVLINQFRKMEGNKSLEKMLHFIESKNGNVTHHDQGVINACFKMIY